MSAKPQGGRVASSVAELTVAADPGAWSKAGFAVLGESAAIGSTRVRLAGCGAGRGILGWSLRGLSLEEGARVPDLDGLPTEISAATPAEPADHPNGATRIDHVVALTPDLDRTVAALERAGLDLRRVRDAVLPGGGMRQAFFRLGDVILEAIEQPAPDGARVDPAKPARLWGLALLTEDLEATAERLGDLLGTPRDAVQPGRRIATVRRAAGLGTAVAFITPAPAR